MQFAQRLKTLRLERDLTQKALGKIVGVSTVAVQCWERGEKKPSMDAIISLSKALKVSVDSLLGLSIEMQDHALVLTKGEKKLLADYRTLDNYGRKAVRTICAIEKERMQRS